jgi:single-stranded-DNA-specific exonuclease
LIRVSNSIPNPILNRNPSPIQSSSLGNGTNDNNNGSDLFATSNSRSRNSPEAEKGRLTKLQKKNPRNISKNHEIQFETGVPSTICLSHREDVDGLSSAALVKSAFKECYVILLDYSNLIRHLKRLSFLISSSTEAARTASSATESSKATASRGASDDDGDDDSAGGGGGKAISIKQSRRNKRLIICDLGLNKKNESAFVEVLGEIVSNGYKVEYIDHHDVGEEIKAELRKVGVTLVHSTEECTSVQVYQRYKKKLNSYSSFYAAAGALTDYLEQRPIASMLVSRFDRHFLMLESTALSYMISSNQHDEKFLLKIVNSISKDRFPHDIEGGFMMAEKYAIRVSEAVKSLEGSITRKKNLAFVRNDLDLTASVIVNFVLGISGRPVALVYKPRDEINSFVISIRGSKECEAHLGRLVNEIASNFGGSGGGHDKASGAVIPKDHLNGFINELNRRI